MSADLMSFVVTTLASDVATSTAFGHTASTPKYHADEVDPGVELPFLVYSEPTETQLRVFTGDSIGTGQFEIGVLDTTKAGARAKLELVRLALNSIPLPTSFFGGGVLIYLRNDDNRSRPIGTTAPGQGVTEYGRAMVFNYKLTRSDTN